MNKLWLLLKLFRKGESVTNPETWKSVQMAVPAVAALILAIVEVAKAFGLELPIDSSIADVVGAGLVAMVNIVLTLITSRKVGVAAAPPLPDAARDVYGNPVLTQQMIDEAKALLEKDRGRSKPPVDHMPDYFKN